MVGEVLLVPLYTLGVVVLLLLLAIDAQSGFRFKNLLLPMVRFWIIVGICLTFYTIARLTIMIKS